MPKLKDIVPLGLIVVSIVVGAGYWFSQKHQLESFVQQIDSIKVNQNKPIEPKDYIAMKRDILTLQNTFNSSVFQLVSGLLFLVTAYTAWLNLVASEKKQITERFAKAVDQLGSNELGVRVGGIFALEQIARSSPEEHWTVIEVLTSYIRDQSLKGKSVFKPEPEVDDNQSGESTYQSILKKIRTEQSISVTTDIQAALTVICRRNNKQDPRDIVIDLSFCDIRGADLKKAKLSNADLRGAKISGVNLENANLSSANLQGANFTRSVLKGARLNKSKLNNALLNESYLEKTDLQDSDLTSANLKYASLKYAKLNRAKLKLAVLVKAELQGANLSQAELKHTNLRDAIIDDTTKLDEKWKRVHQINMGGGRGQKFDGVDFSEAILTDADFEGSSLKNTIFSGADIGGANFRNADLEGAVFRKLGLMTILDMADFGDAYLKGASFEEASLKCTNFSGKNRRTDMSGVIFREVNLASAIFENVLLRKAKFFRSMLQDTNFRRSNLKEAEFDNCYSYTNDTSFEEAALDKAIFIGSLGSANFRNSNHQKANFQDADKSSVQF
ncbi:pentapeptide repeat-containing protein [Nostoc sp. CALU 1950]|uniref:pentapeptide repeat-containing protein n=1 Tax=Nostoc sp. CALU 1950 TaxID=3104321 RepID=UPI003EBC3C2F